MDDVAGLGWTDEGHLYSRQQHETARLVAEAVVRMGRRIGGAPVRAPH